VVKPVQTCMLEGLALVDQCNDSVYLQDERQVGNFERTRACKIHRFQKKRVINVDFAVMILNGSNCERMCTSVSCSPR
jgi:hypothetical protein